jgi:hypothetical protein
VEGFGIGEALHRTGFLAFVLGTTRGQVWASRPPAEAISRQDGGGT